MSRSDEPAINAIQAVAREDLLALSRLPLDLAVRIIDSEHTQLVTLLSFSILTGRVAAACWLLDRGVDVNARRIVRAPEGGEILAQATPPDDLLANETLGDQDTLAIYQRLREAGAVSATKDDVRCQAELLTRASTLEQHALRAYLLEQGVGGVVCHQGLLLKNLQELLTLRG